LDMGRKGLSLLLAFCKIGSEYKHTSICTPVCSIHHHRKVISGSSEIPALQPGMSTILVLSDLRRDGHLECAKWFLGLTNKSVHK
jgi:hypothetical protein